MKAIYLALLAFPILGSAAPRPTGCSSQGKCFTGTNDCQQVYSSCWDECLVGTAAPTITSPSCVHTVTSNVTNTLKATASWNPATVPDITPAPTATTSYCHPGIVCIDGLAFCGNETAKWGGCFETCSGIKPTPPSCTITPTANPGFSTTTKSKSKKARQSCTHSQAWRCAPVGW